MFLVYGVHSINDSSTDNTEFILNELEEEFPDQLLVVTNRVPSMRAGAVNCGLKALDRKSTDIVVVADADSQFDDHLVEAAVKSFENNEDLGGVCSIAGVLDYEPAPKGTFFLKRFERWILWRLQKLEYAGFDAERTQTHDNVLILHGLCTAYNFRLVKSLGGLSSNHLIEDYDLTLRLKEIGSNALFNPDMKAYTEVPFSLKALVRQRLRWMRGGVDVLLNHGLRRFTQMDILNHVLFLSLLLCVVLTVSVGLLSGGWTIALNFSPIPIVLAIIGYLISIYKLRFLGNKIDIVDVIIRLIIIPEIIMAVIMSAVQLYAYFLAFTKKNQGW